MNTVFFKNCERNYHPAQIIIEYNGMWKLEDLLSIRYPRSFELQGVYSTVNGTTLDMYLMNMRNMLMEQLTESELIVVNRCADGVNRSGFRRALKVQNPMAQLIFEDMQGKIIEETRSYWMMLILVCGMWMHMIIRNYICIKKSTSKDRSSARRECRTICSFRSERS